MSFVPDPARHPTPVVVAVAAGLRTFTTGTCFIRSSAFERWRLSICGRRFGFSGVSSRPLRKSGRVGCAEPYCGEREALSVARSGGARRARGRELGRTVLGAVKSFSFFGTAANARAV